MTATRGTIVFHLHSCRIADVSRGAAKQLSSYPGAASSVGHGPKFIRVGRGLKSSGTPFPH